MITNAVTEQGSAPADVAEFETYQAEANARDLARRRGEAPKTEDSVTSKSTEETATQNDEHTADTEDSATSEQDNSETAAASEAASQQEKDSKEQGTEKTENATTKDEGTNGKREKTAASSESRWAKITRENRELRERLARLEGAESVRSGQRDTKQESQPAADGKPAATKPEGTPKPTLADKDDKGQPKFKTYEEFQDARDEWLRAEIKRESAEASKQGAQETERQRAERVVWDEQKKRVDKAREKYSDFDAVAFSIPMAEKTPLFGFVLDSNHGTEVLYHLGKNPADAERIQGKPVFAADGKTITRFDGGLSPIAQIRELSKIEAKFSTTAAPAKRITSAPPPPTVLNGNGAVGSDEVDQALKEGDQEAYSKAANARDLARRRGK